MKSKEYEMSYCDAYDRLGEKTHSDDLAAYMFTLRTRLDNKNGDMVDCLIGTVRNTTLRRNGRHSKSNKYQPAAKRLTT